MSYKEFAIYPAIFDSAGNDIVITFPDLPGAISCADTEETIFMAKYALGAWVVAIEDLGSSIPAPSKVTDIKSEPDKPVCLIEAWLPIFREEQRAGSVK